MRIAENDPRSHRHEFVDKEQAVLEHLLEDQDRPARLCCNCECDRREVGRKSRPRAVLDLRDLAAEIVLDREVLIGGYVQRRVAELDLDPEPLHRGNDRSEILGNDVLDRHGTARHRCEADEAAHLDVVRRHRPLASTETIDAFYPEDV